MLGAFCGSYLRDAQIEVALATVEPSWAIASDNGVLRMQKLPVGPAKVTAPFVGYSQDLLNSLHSD
jgi:hypothetical protein